MLNSVVAANDDSVIIIIIIHVASSQVFNTSCTTYYNLFIMAEPL